MTFKKSSLALLITASVALTGCLSDNYDYSGDGDGNTGGGGGGGASTELGTQVPLYYKYRDDQNSDWDAPYVMYAVDSDGTETAVDGNALPSSSNINVEGEFASAEPLTVTVSDDKASLIFSADKAYDITKANLFAEGKNLGGSIQFYVNTLSYDLGDDPENPNPVLLTMFNGDKTVSTDITSSVIASATGKAQFIRVPLNCFIDDGLDLSKVDIAMAIETEGAIQYEFSQARLANNSVSLTPAGANIQGCYNNNNSKVLADEEVILNRDTRVLDEDDKLIWEVQGETDNIRITRGTLIQHKPSDWGGAGEGAIRFRGIDYDSKFNPDQRSILAFAIEAGSELKDMAIPRLDMSHYMANGELQMAFLLHESALPTGDDTYLVMTMDPPANNTEGIPDGGYPSSETVSYKLNDKVVEGEVHHVSIPLRDFFTKTNGSISLNTLQYAEKLTTHIEQRDSDGTADFSQLAGFKYALADIKLVMNPTDEEPAPTAQ
ncbi:putative glycoside hydrolase [Photobacterium satsumensis]|uniref:putative glycoside hydrolase n=1 Tax=Photobacterium satsumensis TaxID=2910239 RepID=UPI003D145A54